MELAEMLSIKPQDYLKEGFFGAGGELREGINGYYSLGMAYRCREEGVHPDRIQEITERLSKLVEKHMANLSEKPEENVSSDVKADISQIRSSTEVSRSTVLSEMMEMAEKIVADWRSFAALILHLQRITSQLALLSIEAGGQDF